MCISPFIVAFAFACLGDPPQVYSPVPQEVVQAFGLAPHYEKCVMVGRFPVVAGERVHDESIQEAAYLIGMMTLEKPEMLDALAESKTRFSIMAPMEMTTAVPEHSDLAPKAFWDKRARGLGATRQRPAVSCGEENLLCFEGDPYGTENILIHEFAHALHEMALDRVDPSFDTRLQESYSKALEQGIWLGTYAATNRMEYWAEITQSYFDTNRVNDSDHNDVDTREELARYDPRGHALCVEVFGADAPRYTRPFDRAANALGTAHLLTWDRQAAPRFQWPIEVVKSWDRHQAQTLALRPKKGESAMGHLKRRAASEDPAALVEMGWRHREGKGLEQSDALAVVYYQRAAMKGDPAGEDSFGWMLKTGRGVARDDLEAVRFFRLSAEAGFTQGMFNLALMLRDGRGVEAPDHQAAILWLQRASENGHVSSTGLLEQLSP